MPDRTTPCSSKPAIPITPDTGSIDASTLDEARCVVKIGWLWIDSASFSLYVYSASVAIQALTVISMGGVADHPPHRKLLLLSFAALGSLSATLFIALPSTSVIWILCALLAIFANVSFGASVVALNAYLPGLARADPEVIQARAEAERIRMECDSEPESSSSSTSSQNAYSKAMETYNAIVSRTTSRISSQGIAIGYAAGIALLVIALIPVIMMKGSTFSLRLAISLSGIWWAVFTIPGAFWLPGGPRLFGSRNKDVNEEMNDVDGVDADDEDWRLGREIVAAWKRLAQMISPSEIRKLRNTFWFLSAWFLLSDGFTTITNTAVLFAKTTLHMQPTSLIVIGLLTPLAGILGSLLWPKLQKTLGWTNLRALVTLIFAAAIIPLYGCLGFLPFFKDGRLGFGGLTTPGEMYVLAIYFGSLYGAFQSYARSVFSELIPHGEEARWYGLYSITDKSSSFLGPLVVGVIADATGNIRFAFFFLVVMLLLPIPILVFNVDVDKGREDALAYASAKLERDQSGSGEERERLVS
ncbi:Autophagy protein 22 [Tulasnella sp. 418]|nr:Autophagy protein 22 [Tulasnella sp. 418]